MLQRCDEHMHSWINDSIKQDQPDDDVKEKRLGVRRQSEAELWICFVDSHCNLRNQSKAASREAGTRNEPALAGGILVAPGVSPGFTDPKNQEAPAGRQKDAGTNLCRPLRGLVHVYLPKPRAYARGYYSVAPTALIECFNPDLTSRLALPLSAL